MEPRWRTLALFIRDVGFPIFAAAYLLLQITPALHQLNVTMERMVNSLAAQHEDSVRQERQRDDALQLLIVELRKGK